MTEEREGIPSLACGSPDALCFGFRIIVHKRQDGDGFGCDFRQSLVMGLEIAESRASLPRKAPIRPAFSFFIKIFLDVKCVF